MRSYLIGILLLVSSSVLAGEYVFSLSWMPEFCYNSPYDSVCKVLNEDHYVAKNFSLHGLWPNHKTYCSIDPSVKKMDRGPSKWNKLPPLTLSPTTQTQLAEVMPGAASGLDRHEWVKHGTCTGLSQEAYFVKSINLTKQFSTSNFAAEIGSNIGKEVPLATLKKMAVAEFGSNAKYSIQYLCTTNEGVEAATQTLYEMRFYLDADNVEQLNLKQQVATRRGPGKNGCLDGPVYIRSAKEALP